MTGALAIRRVEGKSAWQAWRRGRVKMLGHATLKTLAQLRSRHSMVPDTPFVPNHCFPFIEEPEANWTDIALHRMRLLERTADHRDARRYLRRYEGALLTKTERDQAITDAMQRIAD